MFFSKEICCRNCYYRLLFILILTFMNIAYAANGQVNVTGNIVATACTISPNDQDKWITMGSVPVKQFNDGSGGVTPVPFTLTFTDCSSSISGISVKFTGTADSNNNQLLSLDSDPLVASGIAIALLDSNKVIIPLTTLTQAYPLPGNSTTLAMQFYAQYVKNGLSISAGKANATANFTVAYE